MVLHGIVGCWSFLGGEGKPSKNQNAARTGKKTQKGFFPMAASKKEKGQESLFNPIQKWSVWVGETRMSKSG
jgi:hypothetical protein